jgi:hypothetical protein
MTPEQRAMASRGIAALDIAIGLASSMTALAAEIGVHVSTMCCWRTANFIPLDHVPFLVAAANDPRVSPLSLRPDFREGWALLARQLADIDIGQAHEQEEVV